MFENAFFSDLELSKSESFSTFGTHFGAPQVANGLHTIQANPKLKSCYNP